MLWPACRRFLPVLIVLIAVEGDASAQDLSRHFIGIQGTFVLLNGQTGDYIRHNSQRAAERFAPCSTFKIPNSAILLESGAAPYPEYVLPYDPALNQTIREWARDHSLRSAFKSSVLWYYQALARRVGLPTLNRFVKQFTYGNQNTSGGLDTTGVPFWVDGSLRISADEQVEFLKRFHEGRLRLSTRTTALTKQIMIAEDTPRWRLSAKTGACQPKGEDVVLWYVGSVERAGSVSYFALNMGDTNYDRLFSERVTKARAILTELGILD
jgi:beta-lactamase class D